jgi:hypothetical protein
VILCKLILTFNFSFHLLIHYMSHIELFFFFPFSPEEKQKSIDIESICELLTLVLGSTFPTQVSLFVDYLKVNTWYITLLLYFLLMILTRFLFMVESK